MAHKQSKQKARELYQKGFSCSDISANLKLPLRTIQRWTKEFGQNGSEQPPPENFKLPVPTEKKQQSLSELIQDPSTEWYSFARAIQMNHFLVTYEAREKIQLILDKELSQPDLNFKQINNLSLCLIRHLEYEKDVMMLRLLDINYCAKRLDADGYIVYDPSVNEELS